MDVGKKIKRFRTSLGLSQKELAQRSGMSEPAIVTMSLETELRLTSSLRKLPVL